MVVLRFASIVGSIVFSIAGVTGASANLSQHLLPIESDRNGVN